MVLRTFCVPSLCPLRLKTSSEEKTAKQILILQNKNSRASRERKETILLGSQTLQNGTGIKLVFLRRWGVPKHGRALCIGCTVGQCKAPSGSALRQRGRGAGCTGQSLRRDAGCKSTAEDMELGPPVLLAFLSLANDRLGFDPST